MHSKVAVTSILLLSLYVSVGGAANVLGIFTSNSPSDVVYDMAIMRALAERGHNLTVVTSIPLKEQHFRFHHIYVPPYREDDAEYLRAVSSETKQGYGFDSITSFIEIKRLRTGMQNKTLSHPRFQELLRNEGNRFDAVIIEWRSNNFQLGVAAHFNCPVIISCVNIPQPNLLSLVGNPWTISSVPVLNWNSSQLTTLAGRVRNFATAGLLMAVDLFAEFKMSQLYKANFPGKEYASYGEMKKNISLVFCNMHFSEEGARPMIPGLIEVGGIQCKDEPDPLPKDVQKFLENADDGFILFSLGPNIKTTDFSFRTLMAMFNALSNLKQKVLWKLDSYDSPGRSPNIMFRKWFPQDDLLAHPKLRLFISHAGKSSVAEAHCHGVPMLAIPIVGDQFGIAQNMHRMGLGRVINHRVITEEYFGEQIQEVLTNKSYLSAALRFSLVYRDRPMTPKQSVVYWTEYVIRHRGAKHIQSPAIRLNFFQRNSLDVIAFLGVILYLSFYIIRLILRIIRLCHRKKEKVD